MANRQHQRRDAFYHVDLQESLAQAINHLFKGMALIASVEQSLVDNCTLTFHIFTIQSGVWWVLRQILGFKRFVYSTPNSLFRLIFKQPNAKRCKCKSNDLLLNALWSTTGPIFQRCAVSIQWAHRQAVIEPLQCLPAVTALCTSVSAGIRQGHQRSICILL